MLGPLAACTAIFIAANVAISTIGYTASFFDSKWYLLDAQANADKAEASKLNAISEITYSEARKTSAEADLLKRQTEQEQANYEHLEKMKLYDGIVEAGQNAVLPYQDALKQNHEMMNMMGQLMIQNTEAMQSISHSLDRMSHRELEQPRQVLYISHDENGTYERIPNSDESIRTDTRHFEINLGSHVS